MTWKIDPTRSQLQFSVKHMMISTVRGHFKDFEVDLHFDPDHLEQSTVRARIVSRSVDTQDRTRDDYLRGDFLSPERFPHLIFESTRVNTRGKKITIDGRFRVKDIERPLSLGGTVRGPFMESGKQRMAFDLRSDFDREALGLTFHQTLETVSIVVGKKVTLSVRVELVDEGD